jgi:hypothetical protein
MMRRAFRILKYTVAIFVMLVLIVVVLLLMPSVQTRLAAFATDYLKENFNIDASIGRLSIALPNKIEITDLYIADDHADTMIYAQKLFVAYSGYDALTNTIKSSSVRLLSGKLYLRKYAEDSLFNFGYFLEKFNSGTPPDTNAAPFRLKISSVVIAGMQFEKHRLGCADSCTNIFLKDAQVDIKNFFLDGDDVYADLKHLSFIDKQRFSLHDMHANVSYNSTGIDLQDLYIKTDGSNISGNVKMEYLAPHAFDDFLSLVKLEGNFKESILRSSEFISYIPEFPVFDDFYVNSKFTGPVNDLFLEDCEIRLGKSTSLIGNVRLKNPSESDLLRIDANLKRVSTTPDEFKKYVTQFTGEMEWMEFIEPFKNLTYSGIYQGGIADFKVDGRFIVDENDMLINAQMAGFDNLSKTSYEGVVIANKLNLGLLTKNETFGSTQFEAKIKGRGLTADALNAVVDAKVNFIDINGYRYSNFATSGNIENNLFDGKASLLDPNLKLDFEGFVNYQTDTVIADFNATITDANLLKLGFSDRPVSILNFKTNIDYEIIGQENWQGLIEFTDITYSSSEAFYFFDTVKITSTFDGEFHRDILQSKLLEAELSGRYKIIEVADAFYSEYLNFNKLDITRKDRPLIDFDYNIHLNNVDILTNLFIPELQIEPGTSIEGLYMGLDQQFFMHLLSEQVSYNQTKLKKINLIVQHNDSFFEIKNKIGSIEVSRQFIDSIQLTGTLKDDSAFFSTSGIFRDSIDSYFRLSGYALDIDQAIDTTFRLFVNDGRFNIGNNYFDLIKNNAIIFSKDDVEIINLGFEDKVSSIVLNGHMGSDLNKVLRLSTNNLSLDLANYVLRDPSIFLEGRINGDVIFSRENELPKFAGDILIDSLRLNNDYLGDLQFYSNWDPKSNRVSLDAELLRGKLDMVKISGTYLPDSLGDLNFKVSLNRFRLNWVNPFVEGILANVRGAVSGDINLTGTFKDIKTNGSLTLTQVGLAVPIIGTDYVIDGAAIVDITPEKISLLNATMRDTKERTTASLDFTTTHRQFKNFAFNMLVKTDNLLAMNLENTPDAMFYGKAYAAGSVTLTGPLENLVMSMSLRTLRNTDFKIPFSNPVSISESSFITYTGKSSTEEIILDIKNLQKEQQEKEFKPLGGFSLFMEIDITPDANIELVMDETVGDIIRGRGKGNLRIRMPNDGDMEMFGTVEITSGDYLFTMRNLLNKRFVVVPGGTLSWGGSPYDAVINMKARYSTRTTLTGIVTSPDYQNQRVQVDLVMDLQGLVTNPNISFEILIPTSNPSYQEELRNRLSDPDKLNQQAFSLLLINSFWLDEVATENNMISQGIGSNTMQMLASQVSNMLGQGLGKYIDISVGYSTALGEQANDEFELDISKSFMNDRLTVNSKIDVPVGTSTSTTSQSFTGDIEVVYRITSDGRIRAKAFNRSNQDNPSLSRLANYSQGAGIFYVTNFNTFPELVYNIFGVKMKALRNEDDLREIPEDVKNNGNNGNGNGR